MNWINFPKNIIDLNSDYQMIESKFNVLRNKSETKFQEYQIKYNLYQL